MQSTNGTTALHPADTVAPHCLPSPPQEGSETERLILAGYDELRRRDTLGMHDKWHWKLMAMGLLVYCGITQDSPCGLASGHAPFMRPCNCPGQCPGDGRAPGATTRVTGLHAIRSAVDANGGGLGAETPVEKRRRARRRGQPGLGHDAHL